MVFLDKHSRMHSKPVTGGNQYPCNNAFLYSGYAQQIKILDEKDSLLIQECWRDCQTKYGFNRHPDGDLFPSSSHDELVGMFMIIRRFRKFGPESHWQICNLPQFKPIPWYKLNPFKVIRDFWRLSREENPRKSTQKYPYIWPIVFHHSGQHIYFYERVSGARPSISRKLHFVLASMFTILVEGSGGRDMLGFKLLRLYERGPEWPDRLILWAYDKRINFLEEVEKEFSEWKDIHPITSRIRELCPRSLAHLMQILNTRPGKRT